MKPQEILLASALIALVGGAGAALASRAFLATSERAALAQRASLPEPQAAPTSGGAAEELADLRASQAVLLQRLAALEARLGELSSARTAATVGAAVEDDGLVLGAPSASSSTRREPSEPLELTPDFVASVEQALTRIRDEEEAERVKARKEFQAQRIEERVTRLQQELGLTNQQTTQLRSVLIAQDDKREALLGSLHEGTVEPSSLRDTFRTLRDDTHAELQRVLSPEQYEAYRKSEDTEFGRRGGDFGPPVGRPPERDFGRSR